MEPNALERPKAKGTVRFLGFLLLKLVVIMSFIECCCCCFLSLKAPEDCSQKR